MEQKDHKKEAPAGIEKMSKQVSKEVLEAGKTLQKNEVSTKDRYTPPKDQKPEDTDPYRSREVAKEKPPTKVYDPPVPPPTPNSKDKSKGRSL